VSIPTPQVDTGSIGPILALAVTAMVLMVLAVTSRRGSGGLFAAVSLIGLAVAGLLLIPLATSPRVAFSGLVIVDALYAAFAGMVLLGAALTVLAAPGYLQREGLIPGEFLALVIFSTSGALILLTAHDLVVALLGVETMTIALYVLAGYARGRLSSEESALKYFLNGAFSFGFLLYGTALVFGATGSTEYSAIASALQTRASNPMVLVGLGLLLVGLAFKLSLAPFHMWTPDVYQGAPTVVTAFMAAATKAAVFGALLRLLTEALPSARHDWAVVLWALAILSMVVGNVAALAQRDVKRLLAYSSVSQAGYVLVAIVAANRLGASGVAYYVVAYVLMTVGAFAVVVAVSRAGDAGTEIEAFAGLGRRSPWLAAAMALFMFSLIGVPPTAGFLAKFNVLAAAVQAGYVDLAVIGALTSALGAFYYLRVIVTMYGRAPAEDAAPIEPVPAALAVALIVAAFGVIQMGVLPVFPLDASQVAAAALAR
jgi:NADH-quinone oxidoreductase subunit N